MASNIPCIGFLKWKLDNVAVLLQTANQIKDLFNTYVARAWYVAMIVQWFPW